MYYYVAARCRFKYNAQTGLCIQLEWRLRSTLLLGFLAAFWLQAYDTTKFHSRTQSNGFRGLVSSLAA